MLEEDHSVTTPCHLQPLRFGSVTLPSRYMLSPLAGYTNLAFRLAVRRLGKLSLATTDLISARGLLESSDKTFDLIRTCPEDRPLAVQIYGAVADEMCRAAQWLEGYGASVIDINMGCPVRKVTRGGGGSALMCDAGNTIGLVGAIVNAVRIPVTVKMRLGWDEQSLSAPFFAREFEKVGVAGVIIHGRTREQGFKGSVNLDGIRSVVEAVERIPVIGNGDVCTVADADRMLRHTGCAGISIGRGALLNPWIFCQLEHWEKTGETGPPPTWEQRIDFMERHYHMLVEYRGEHFGSLTFRKIAGWYCKVLKPGRDIQQKMVYIAKVTDFDQIVDEMRMHGPPRNWHMGHEAHIAVPSGPISHW